MFSAFFVTILISLASGVGFDLKDILTIEVKSSPLPTPLESSRPEVAAASPAPQEGGTLTGPTSSPIVSKDCDFEYHKTTTNGKPIDFHYNCTEKTGGGGTASSSVNIEANSSGGGNTSGRVNVDISVKNN